MVETIRNFNSIGESIYGKGSLKDIAKSLSSIAEGAAQHTLSEVDDMFDKVTVSRNMKELTNLSKQFGKVASEANSLQERMSGLYEDMGHVLNRYYEIDEAHVYGHNDEDSEVEEKLDKVDPSKVEPEDDFEDREDKDIDNDGDVDDSDEYLHKKRQAISKAIKKESSIGGVVGIPALGDFVKGK